MAYNKLPKMILFDVGGTLFDDGRCDPIQGFEKLRLFAANPDITTAERLAGYWDEYLDDVSGIKSKSGITLDIPLSAVIRYATMNTGLVLNIPMAEQEEIFDRYNSTRQVIDGTVELLDTLRALKIRTAVISNNMMSSEGLSLAIKKWIPTSSFEFCLTSADLLFTKPSKNIFLAALSYAGLDPADCWYCGDSKIPDVDGASGCGIKPVLLDAKSTTPFKYKEHENSEYLTVNNWKVLKDMISNI